MALARTLGVKISVANNFIKNLENKNIVENVGGYSGHRIYQKKLNKNYNYILRILSISPAFVFVSLSKLSVLTNPID